MDEKKLSNRTIPVQIDDVCCSVRCHDTKTAEHLRRIYAGFTSKNAADVDIELDVVGRFGPDYIESVLPAAKLLKWGEHVAVICRTNGNCPSSVRPCVHTTVEKLQLTPRYEFKIMNTLLPAVYYTLQRRWHPDILPAMIVHACGIVRDGRLIIFAGPSETGKTTVARLCGNEHGRLINDEMVLIAGDDSGKFVGHGIPIIGGVPQRSNETAPLACVMMLKQSWKTSVRSLERVDAYLRFIRQIIAPRDLLMPDDNRIMLGEISRFADAVTRTVPFFELEFTLDKGPLWKAVEEVERVL